MPFNKPPLAFKEQLELLKKRGLQVDDPSFAIQCLQHHNYYRLSAYRFPLAQKGNPDQFADLTTFDDLWELYCFDRDLRLLVMEAVKRVEISVRTNIAYTLAHRYGPFAYENSTFFADQARHAEWLARFDEEQSRSKEVFTQHYREKYALKRPPVWAACEIMSFGALSKLYANIKADKTRKEIAAVYGLMPTVMKSFLLHAVYIRNICAHHSRLWNRQFIITVSLPRKNPACLIKSLNPSSDRLLYNTLTLLTYMLQVIDPDSGWRLRLLELLEKPLFPVTQHMGFPDAWEERPLWTLSGE